VGFGEDRESICQVVRVRRKVVGPLIDSWRVWRRAIKPVLCIWGIEGGLGSLEQLRNTCWGDNGIIQVLFEFCDIFVDVLQLL
jgi:hypothetical protein